jgi:hypothetical protein
MNRIVVLLPSLAAVLDRRGEPSVASTLSTNGPAADRHGLEIFFDSRRTPR